MLLTSMLWTVGAWPVAVTVWTVWIAPGVVEGLNPWKDEDHARTQEVPR